MVFLQTRNAYEVLLLGNSHSRGQCETSNFIGDIAKFAICTEPKTTS